MKTFMADNNLSPLITVLILAIDLKQWLDWFFDEAIFGIWITFLNLRIFLYVAS